MAWLQYLICWGITLIGIFCVWAFLMDPKGLRKKPQKPVEPEDPWATFKRYQAEHRKYVATAHKEWLEEAWAILQRHCQPHYYHHQKWYTCMNCGHEEPWEWDEQCQCRYETVTRLGSSVTERVLIERVGYCPSHGRDFTSFPISLRENKGKYGHTNPAEDGTKRGMELQRTMSRKKIRFVEDLK